MGTETGSGQDRSERRPLRTAPFGIKVICVLGGFFALLILSDESP